MLCCCDYLCTVTVCVHICCFSDSTTCDTGDIRLVGGTLEREGRLELCFGGQWSTVTDDGFSTYDAMVACRMLGYLDGCEQA